jgi:hypothetical protein
MLLLQPLYNMPVMAIAMAVVIRPCRLSLLPLIIA